ncbi:hypothetical protein [Endothiovibrio diazotrophicus]
MVLVAGALIGASYWAVAYLHYPAEPFYVKLLLRMDAQYFPLIESLSRLEFSPTYSAVFSGSGLVDFPLAALIPHAIGFALAGPHGFILVDMLAVAIAAYAFYTLFRLGTAPKYLAALLAIVCVGSMFIPFIHHKIYAFRIPRPEISNLYFTLFLGYALLWFRRPRLFLAGRGSRRRTVAFGVVTALVLQSQIYFFFIALAVLLFLLTESLVSRRVALDRGTGKAVGLFVLSFVVVGLPFLIQLQWGEPDLKARMGVYAASHRELVLGLFTKPILAGLALPCGLAAVLAYLSRRRRRALRVAWFSTVMPPLAAIAGIGFLAASPLHILPYHVPSSVRNVDQIALLLLIPLLRLLLLRVPRRFTLSLRKIPPRLTGAMVGAAILVVVARSFTDRYAGMPTNSLAVSARFGLQALDRYREDLGAVIDLLRRAPGSAPRLLLTNDYYLSVWWVMERQGTLLMPNVFNVVLTDRQVEEQLIQAGKYLGWNTAAWASFLTQDALHDGRIDNLNLVFFLGCNKYQASALHSWAPLDDYPVELRDAVSGSTSSWSTSLPLSERRRLKAAYSAAPLDPRFAPDLIVMGKLRDTPPVSPSANYRVTNDLANFEVWQQRAADDVVGTKRVVP